MCPRWRSEFTNLCNIYCYITTEAWIPTIPCVSAVSCHVFSLKTEQKEWSGEPTLFKKRRGHGRIEWVRQISGTKRRRRERMCVGDEERSGMGITDTLGRWWMVFVEAEIHLGAIFPWHYESDDSAQCRAWPLIGWSLCDYSTCCAFLKVYWGCLPADIHTFINDQTHLWLWRNPLFWLVSGSFLHCVILKYLIH